jgi:nucleotide-binding universal stress UspA family protein
MSTFSRRHPYEYRAKAKPQTAAYRIDNARLDPDAGPILVAVDGNSRSWDALDWAAAEAAARGSDLSIIHVFSWPFIVDASGLLAAAWDASVQEAAEHILNEAVRHARLVAPTVRISTRLQAGARVQEVLREDRHDALIVLGRSRPKRRFPRLHPTMSDQVARQAHCAVALVGLADPGSGGLAVGRVLVGLDGKEERTAALGSAFRAASRRRVGLTVLHASTPINAHDHGRMNHPAMIQSWTTRAVQNALSVWQLAFPDVPVLQRLDCAQVGEALAAESTGAALVVLGTRSDRRSDKALTGAAGRMFWRSIRSTVNLVSSPVPGK